MKLLKNLSKKINNTLFPCSARICEMVQQQKDSCSDIRASMRSARDQVALVIKEKSVAKSSQ